MRKRIKPAFRPAVESIELRIAASSGLTAPAQALGARAHVAAKAEDHAKPIAKDQVLAKGHATARHKPHKPPKGHANPPQVPSTPTNPPVARPVPSRPAPPPTNASAEAWVKLVNTTGQDLRYQISLGPYRDGQFLAFDIAGRGNDSVQYRYASLVVDGRQVEPSFAIKFGNGPTIALNTGPSANSAQGYYIFFDGNFQPYVSPFTDSKAT